jgi:hypothetical protein
VNFDGRCGQLQLRYLPLLPFPPNYLENWMTCSKVYRIRNSCTIIYATSVRKEYGLAESNVDLASKEYSEIISDRLSQRANGYS